MYEGAREQVVQIISAEELELNCLEMIDLVAEKGFIYVITKNGEPIAKMKPVPPGPDSFDTSGDAGTTLTEAMAESAATCEELFPGNHSRSESLFGPACPLAAAPSAYPR